MCYSASVAQGARDLIERYTQARWIGPETFPSFAQTNAKALPVVPVIPMGTPNEIHPVRWLMVPPGINTMEGIKSLKIWYANARIEELEQKKTYRPLIRNNRCIICFTDFYEWRHEGTKKIKYRIGLGPGIPLLIPGLWTSGIVHDRTWASCTLCTTEARGIMRYIHNTALRMPVIVNTQGMKDWLDSSLDLPEARQRVIDQEQSPNLICDPPVLTRETTEPEQGELF